MKFVAALVIAVMLLFSPALTSTTDAKITPAVEECVNGGGNLPGGQQPTCTGDGLTQIDEPAKNPAGHAPPGQN